MIIGERLRMLREAKRLTQGDIEKRTGLLRSYISRVENGQTVPQLVTLEKFARAMGVPLYQVFYEGEKPPELLKVPKHRPVVDFAWSKNRKDARFWRMLLPLLPRMSPADRQIFLSTAQKMASR